jgi:hypothetical protein
LVASLAGDMVVVVVVVVVVVLFFGHLGGDE